VLADALNDEAESVLLARDALERGQQALAAGDAARAVTWFDRACRLAPDDHTLTLQLAAACLGRDDERAATLFRNIADKDDVREAWLGLAAACRNLRDPQLAADALAQALARHAPAPALFASGRSLADEVVSHTGEAGWCGLNGRGELSIRAARDNAVEVRLDGRLCRGRRLPAGWQRRREVAVQAGARHLLGSPIQIGAIRRLAGYVESRDGGLVGWAWHPGDPDVDPVVCIRPPAGRGELRIVATDQTVGVQHARPLARPRGFSVAADALADLRGLLRVTGRDGTDLMGSPIDPQAEHADAAAAAAAVAALRPVTPVRRPARPFVPPAIPAETTPPRTATGETRRQPPADVVIPVHGRADLTLACLSTVLVSVRPPSRVVVVDDASDEPALVHALDALAAQRRIRLIRHPRNLGFPASANAGVAACAGRDVVLLNSDTLVPPGWLNRLRAAAYAAPGIGTATPLSNHATIVSYPGPPDRNRVPDLAETIRLDATAARANPGTVVDIPVAVGFCMYLRRDCIETVGRFRAEVFAQGYGEENDFCLRARHLGWRHVAVPGVFVAHVGGASFGQAGRHLQARNERLLNRMHPGYDRLVAAHVRADPLADARRRIDLLRWRAAGRRGAQSAILVTHNEGGGVERQVAASATAHAQAGRRAIVLRPGKLPDDTPAIVVSAGIDDSFPNLRYAMPAELPALLRLLRAARPGVVELHHVLGHSPAIYDLITRLGVPYDVHLHDYPWFCPQVSLVGADRRYCGEPAAVRCEACVADAGRIIDEDIPIVALRERSDRFLRAARGVVAPSADAASRLRRHFHALRPVVRPQEDDAAMEEPPPPRPHDGICRVCVIGAIGVHKGYDILLQCARDAAERRLKLDFVVVGHTIDDARLLATGRVFITGRFKPDEAVPLVRQQYASLGLLPSVWPETWSFALSELWRGGLRVAAFDFGAPAERIRKTGRGFVLPLGLPASGINNALVAAVGLTSHAGV
jgi:GT2 family glycosyltransferase